MYVRLVLPMYESVGTRGKGGVIEQDSRLAIAPFLKAGGKRPVPALSSKGTMVASDATLKPDQENGFCTSKSSKVTTPLRTATRAYPARGSRKDADKWFLNGYLKPASADIEFDVVEGGTTQQSVGNLSLIYKHRRLPEAARVAESFATFKFEVSNCNS